MYKIKSDIIAAIFIASILFWAVVTLGISLAVIPLYINTSLSSFFVGLAIAVQSLSTLLTRAVAGNYSDKNGPRKGMFVGLLLTFISGAVCLFIFSNSLHININYSLLLLSRVIMGVGESFIFTCTGTWAIGLIGREHAGKIMSWVGIAMFLGLALGNYTGTFLFYKSDIIYSGLLITFLPFIGIIISCFVRAVPVINADKRNSLIFAIKKIWKPGLGFALANTGYAAVMTYLVLFYASNDWENSAALALSMFGIGYVFSRITLGWLADKAGIKMTVVSLTIESTGLLMIGFSISPYIAMIGSFLTGFGLSMVYPLLALPALKSMPEESTGLALSTYESCFDIGMLSAGFIGGIIISIFGYASVYLLSFVFCIISIFLSILAYQQIKLK
ncbi:MFS transporter [Salmonella enterica]|uniref:MFS transporter n=1 Tax=Salmonella enterica I TaxID=59201 RepID=A0A5U3G6A2_SALET|nr:MFS transporter [Salmonella enterica]EBP4060790.1 MFS transporter [Salmonella enterica subsp. enterica]EDI0749059.1 MFS transporter [Salmonella enterica subsp. enterica serovar Kisarawe]AXD45929.1 MFS transporter [Salmonella enterica]EAS5879380.1 MFS transporter [Salmonella enterica]EAU6767160.1 MFS transporter [Salmonella enterica]